MRKIISYKECKKIVKKLGIRSQKEYREKYKKSSLLHLHPERIYKDKGWVDWFDFLGKRKRIFYSTYKEAKAAVRKLGIQSVKDYKKKYLKDPHLPSHPDEVYHKNWRSWKDFLGKISK